MMASGVGVVAGVRNISSMTLDVAHVQNKVSFARVLILTLRNWYCQSNIGHELFENKTLELEMCLKDSIHWMVSYYQTNNLPKIHSIRNFETFHGMQNTQNTIQDTIVTTRMGYTSDWVWDLTIY